MAQTDPWSQFPAVSAPPATDRGHMATLTVPTPDGGWDQFQSTGDQPAAPPQPQQPVAPTLNGAGMSPAGPADVIGAPQEVVFGDQDQRAGRPNLRLTPEQESQVAHILGTAPIDAAAEQARAYLRSIGWPGAQGDNFDNVIEARRKTGKIREQFHYAKPQYAPSAVTAGLEGAGEGSTVGAAPKILSLLNATNKALGLGGGGDAQYDNTDYGSFANNYNASLDQYEGQRSADVAEHPYIYIGGQLAGGALLPSGAMAAADRAAAMAGREALRGGATMEEARTIAQVAGRQAMGNRAALEGAGYGGGYGALSSDTPQDALKNGIAGAGLGALAGKGAGELGRFGSPSVDAATRNASPALTSGQETMAAANRLGIDVLPADVGGPVTRRATSVLAQTIPGGQPIIAGARNALEQAQGARDSLAAAAGQVLEPEAFGNEIRRGTDAYIASSRAQKNGLYTAAESAAGDTRIQPTKALSVLDRNIAELEQTPGGAPALEQLKGLRDQLAKGAWPVTGLRQMRSVLRDQFMKDGLRGSDTERRIGQVLDAVKEDVTDGLTAAGKGNAASLYAKADGFARDRIQTIDDVLTPILGKDGSKSGEQVVRSLMADMQGNNARAVKLLNTLPADAQGNVRASIIGSLGAQDKQAGGFSLDRFLRQWESMGKSAKRAYFGSEGMSALDDLAKVAQGSKEAMSYANRSNTGGAVGNLLTGGTFLAGVPALLGTVVTQYGAGRLLASPRVARWIARAPKTQLSPTSYIERLGRIAKAEPAIAPDIFGLQKALTDAFSGGVPLRAAADQNPQEPGVADGNSAENQPQSEGAQP